MGRLILLLCIIPTMTGAQMRPNRFEGTWIWDRSQFLMPPKDDTFPRMVAQTWFVARDDGVRFTARIEEVNEDGSHNWSAEDLAEDGVDHRMGWGDHTIIMRISVLPDGRKHGVSGSPGDMTRNDSICTLSPDGVTKTCVGTYRSTDGSVGPFRSVYHRFRAPVPVAAAGGHRIG
jgi:hypothetical protein